MDKTELIKKVAEDTCVKEDVVRKVFNSMVSIIQESLLFGINVKIKGFIVFSLDRLKGRIAKNPQNGEPVTVPPRYVVRTRLPRVFTDKIKAKKVY